VEAERRQAIWLAVALDTLQATEPKATTGAAANPVPVIVTSVPACEPLIGLTVVTSVVWLKVKDPEAVPISSNVSTTE
jgi:hypothetical protein